MAQGFVTHTMDAYRWPHFEGMEQRYESLYEQYFKQPLSGEEWQETGLTSNPFKEISDVDVKKGIKKMMKNRYRTCYNHCYGRNPEEEENINNNEVEVEEDKEEESELIRKSREMYDPQGINKQMQPLPSFKITMGYHPASEFARKLSIYQNDYSKLGYEILIGKHRKSITKTMEKEKQDNIQEDEENFKSLKEKKERKKKVCHQYRRKHRTFNILLE